VESDPREATAARQRQAAMVEQLRKAELVRDRLQGLNQLVGTYPEGHDTRVLLENLKNLNLERALEAVEEDIRDLMDRLVHPRGT
jgi:chemotaxis regulatin CheY-phosphate phosphatase CheZ